MEASLLHHDAAAPEALDHVKVLILEDNRDVRDSLKLLLEICGATVTAAGTSREALTALRRFHPDVVLSDIGLPDENGLSFIRRVRALPEEDGGKVPAIALTAYSEILPESLKAGFQAGVRKPADPSYLLALILKYARRGWRSRD